MTAAPLLWINGFPGSGKLTVARELVNLSGSELILIDNHQLIDPVEARMSRDHPDYQKERQLQGSSAFRDYVANDDKRSTVIFTGRKGSHKSILPLPTVPRKSLSSPANHCRRLPV
jgi:hypothetical protein